MRRSMVERVSRLIMELRKPEARVQKMKEKRIRSIVESSTAN